MTSEFLPQNAPSVEEWHELRGYLDEMKQHRSEIDRQCRELEHRLNQIAHHIGVGYKQNNLNEAVSAYSHASLGWNCEAAYQFRRVTGVDQASFFNWTYCSYLSMKNIILNDFQELLQWDNLIPSGIMIYDRRHDISFHGSVFHATNNGQYVELAKLHLASLQSKVYHLIEKWQKMTGSGSFVTYFLKLPNSENARVSACDLRELLKQRYPTHRFEIVVLQSLEQNSAEPDWNENAIHNRYLERFASDERPDLSDDASWDRIFTEFPGKSQLR